jgi:hypothetical protein
MTMTVLTSSDLPGEAATYYFKQKGTEHTNTQQTVGAYSLATKILPPQER